MRIKDFYITLLDVRQYLLSFWVDLPLVVWIKCYGTELQSSHIYGVFLRASKDDTTCENLFFDGFIESLLTVCFFLYVAVSEGEIKQWWVDIIYAWACLTVIMSTKETHLVTQWFGAQYSSATVAQLRSTERKHWALRPQKPLRLIRDGEVGGSGIWYLTPTRYTVTTRMIVH